MNLHFVYFASIHSYPDFDAYITACGFSKEYLVKYNKLEAYKNYFEAQVNNTKDKFLNKINSEDYYFFIISKKQLNLWEDFLTHYGMKEFIHYKRLDIPNMLYADEKKLNIFILKFNAEFVAKWK